MDRLSYRKKLWEMTDEQVEEETRRLRNWKNTDEFDLFQEARSAHSRRQYRAQQSQVRQVQMDNEAALVLEYNLRAQHWLLQGVTRDEKGNYTYKGELLLAGVGYLENISLQERIEQQREADKVLNMWKEMLK